MSLIALSGVGVEFGATTLFKDITFTIARGDRWGVVGRNGIGKTTLFKLITGAQQPTSGQVARSGAAPPTSRKSNGSPGAAWGIAKAATAP